MSKRDRIYQITMILLVIDQIIKIIVHHTMNLYQEIPIISNFFSIFYVKNTGAAFSILNNQTVFLTIISAIFVILVDQYIRKEKDHFDGWEVSSFGMILGGIFGNMIDRIIHQGVIDYLSFQFGHYSFPVFNFADICIVLGVIILIGYSVLFKNKLRK